MAELFAVSEEEEEEESRERVDQRENLMLKMYKAIDHGNVVLLNELLDNGGDTDCIYVDEANISTKTLLHICCEKGQLACVQSLIDRGAYLSARDNWGQTPLMFCVLADRIDVAEMLLTHQPSLVNDSDKYGENCLHFAANNGKLGFMKILYKYGVMPDRPNQSGYTPLMTAILSRDIENSRTRCNVINMLISNGSDYELREPRGRRSALQVSLSLSLSHSPLSLSLNLFFFSFFLSQCFTFRFSLEVAHMGNLSVCFWQQVKILSLENQSNFGLYFFNFMITLSGMSYQIRKMYVYLNTSLLVIRTLLV